MGTKYVCPSITEESIAFLQVNNNISNDDIRIIKNSRKSCYSTVSKQEKRNPILNLMLLRRAMATQKCVNLQGYLYCYILQNLSTTMMPGHTEMMIVVKNLNDLQIDRLRKNIVQVFKNFWFLKSKSKRNQLNLTFLMSLLA